MKIKDLILLLPHNLQILVKYVSLLIARIKLRGTKEAHPLAKAGAEALG